MAERGADLRGADRPTSSIRRLLIGYLLIMGLLGGGFALGTVLLVRAADRDRAAALIEGDIAETLEKIGTDPAMQRDRAFAIVLARATRGDGRLYRLEQNDAVVAGLPAEVAFRPSGAWLESADPAALARRVPLAGGGSLLIGRELEQGALTHQLLVSGSIALGVALTAAALIGLIAVRRLRRRVEAINDACDQVRLGDFAARAPGATGNDEFALLSAHVNGMLERIDTLVQGLRDVSNRIAHDLRTPVARLRTSLEAAAGATELPAARAMAGAAAAETDDILQTFEALLDIAEVEAGSTGGLAPMRLDEAAESVVDLYASVAEARGIALVAECAPATILGERTLVVRLAANLVDNAIKFSPEGGRVVVGVAAGPAGAILSVRDRGPGIAPADRDRLMGRYQRGDATRHVRGHGLGLALVSAVAKRHGARVMLTDATPGLAVAIAFETFG